jgi:hypothetical protein
VKVPQTAVMIDDILRARLDEREVLQKAIGEETVHIHQRRKVMPIQIYG